MIYQSSDWKRGGSFISPLRPPAFSDEGARRWDADMAAVLRPLWALPLPEDAALPSGGNAA